MGYNKRQRKLIRLRSNIGYEISKARDYNKTRGMFGKDEEKEGVSVCISAWNTQDYIEECLDSVAKQTWFAKNNEWEILLGIDGCEKTLEKVKSIMGKYRNLRVFMMESNMGTYVTCNTIMKQAKYGWLLRFDSDDVMNPEMVETLMECKGDAEFVRWKLRNFGGNSNVEITFGMQFYKKKLFEKYNGYKPWMCSADEDFINRISNFQKIVLVDRILMKRRVHPGSLTMKKETGYNSEFRKKYIDFVTDKGNYDSLDKCVNENCVTNSYKIVTKDRIIVSFTSWKKRIQYCKHTVDLMKSQTILPYKIILNLSSDEFENMEADLPEELVAMQDDLFEIYWVKENTKVHKKIIHTLNRFPDDIIVSIDDDIEYPNNFIELEYKEFLRYDGEYPITSGNYRWGNDMFTNGERIYTHYGCFSMIKNDFFGKYLEELYKNVVLKFGVDVIPYGDPIITYAALLNGKHYKFTENLNMSKIRSESDLNKKDCVSNVKTKQYENTMLKEHKIIQEYIMNNYGKTYSDLAREKIIVSFTTWKKRHDSVVKMLENFKKQTIKPDKIICWLSSEEYEGENIPDCLKKFVEEEYIEIRWVKKNTYCHKRYDIFKEYNDCYVFMLDDDILYPIDYIDKMYHFAKENNEFVIDYYTTTERITDCVNKLDLFTKEATLKNCFLSGFSCFPPNTFPTESFKYEEERDKITKKCDDSWVKAWLIKKNIKIKGIYEWVNGMPADMIVEDSQNDAIWIENCKITNGIKKRVSNLAKCILFLNIEKEANNIYPNFNIKKSSCNELDM